MLPCHDSVADFHHNNPPPKPGTTGSKVRPANPSIVDEILWERPAVVRAPAHDMQVRHLGFGQKYSFRPSPNRACGV